MEENFHKGTFSTLPFAIFSFALVLFESIRNFRSTLPSVVRCSNSGVCPGIEISLH